MITATARHFSLDRRISGIYYEVWNEPDLFGGWHYSRSPSYSDLYLYTSRAVVAGAGSAGYKIGGPAITAFYPNWIKALFKTASQNNLRLDFISWHKYSKNANDYLADIETLNDILSDYPQYFDIERLITETGPNPEPDRWYDTSLSGIHLISLSTQLAGKIHRRFTFEAFDGPTPRSDVSTGWGLISRTRPPKPRYYALDFLNRLNGRRLSSGGDGSWVTSLATKNGASIQLLLVNYDSRGNHAETFPVTFQNLTPGNYTLKTTTYLGSTTSKTITATYNYSTQIYLNPNSAIILELIPQ